MPLRCPVSCADWQSDGTKHNPVDSNAARALVGAGLAEQDIIVIGAGVIGAATALALRREGHGVLLIDREGPAAGASFGNAGAVVNESCAPTAMPGVWKQALASIGDPLSPLSIRPSYLPRAAPWLIRFLLASRPGRVLSIARDLHALSRHAASDWRELTKGTELDRFFHEGGWLKVYETDAAFNKTSAARELMDALGVGYELLTADDIRGLEPALAPIFRHGIFQKSSLRCDDTAGLVRAMVDLAVASGAAFRIATVARLEPRGDRVRVHCDSDTLDARRVVLAAGARSRELAAQVGHRLPLDTERGYHVMLPRGTEALLSRPVLNGERSFVLSPMRAGLRMTSQVEIAGVDAPPNFARVRHLLPEAKRMLPDLDAREESVWMGCRPSLPDSLPVIGPARDAQNVLFAFGHQHLGLTLAAVTAFAVAAMVAGREPAVDLSPYRPERF